MEEIAVLIQTVCASDKKAELNVIVLGNETVTAKVDKPLVPMILLAETDILPF